MRNILFLATILLTACGSSTPDAITAAVTPSKGNALVPTNYTYHVTGLGVEYAAALYVNLGSPEQVETLVPSNVIADAGGIDHVVTGENTVAEFANHSGGTLSVEALRDGVTVETKTATPGNSIHFNIDIE